MKSLGVRREARAVPELAKLLTDADELVAGASAASLGDIATPDAFKALESQLDSTKGSTQSAVVDGCLRCAQHWLADGKNKAAFKVYQEFYQRPGKEFVQVAAWRGMVLADGAQGLKLMAEAIVNGPAPLQMAAIQLVHEVKAPATTKDMAALLTKVDPLTQVALIDALSQRDDPAAAPEIAGVAGETNAEVRVAAFTALGTLGDDQDIPLLIEAAATADEPAQAAARQALALVHRGAPDQALLALLSGSKPQAQVEILKALGSRSAVETTPQILDLARQSEDPVRAAAFQALARLVDQPHLDALVQIVAQMTTDDGRTAAAQAVGAACRHIQRQRSTADMTSVWDRIEKRFRRKLRASRCCPFAAAWWTRRRGRFWKSGVADADPRSMPPAAVRICATRWIRHCCRTLKKIASGSTDEASRTPAIEACVRLATQEETITIPDPDRIKLFQTIVPAAVNADEKRSVLSGLAAAGQLRQSATGATAHVRCNRQQRSGAGGDRYLPQAVRRNCGRGRAGKPCFRGGER